MVEKLDIDRISKFLRDVLNLKENWRILLVYTPTEEKVMEVISKALFKNRCSVYAFELPEETLVDIPEGLKEFLIGIKPHVVFNLLRHRKEEISFRIKLIKFETKLGCKVAHSPGITYDMLRLFQVDVEGMEKRKKEILSKIGNAKKIRIKNKEGTDIVISIEGRRWIDDLHIDFGEMGNLPNGEIFIAPIEDSADGIIVSNLNGAFGKQKVKIYVKNGKIEKIEGERAEELYKFLSQDENGLIIGEFGIGLNDYARKVENFLEAEKVWNTCHIAFGNNVDMGGKNKSKIHVDFLIDEPEFEVIE